MRLIDADALITFWTECLTQEEIDTWDMRIATVIENVKDQPTVDAVKVVRCKDCKYFNPHVMECEGIGKWFGLEGEWGANDYCSKAESKDDE